MHSFPAGKYYIGDPCYALSEDIYDNCWGEAKYALGKMSTPLGDFIVASTAYGDGEYVDDDGFKYPVDSGTIAVIPWTMCEQMDETEANTCGRVHVFEDDGTFEEEDGVITIESECTDIVIDTTG